MFGFNEEQIAWFGLTVGVGAFFNVMNFGQMLLWHVVLIPIILIALVGFAILLAVIVSFLTTPQVTLREVLGDKGVSADAVALLPVRV